MKKTAGQTRTTVSKLRELFDRNGCLRLPDRRRRKADGQGYKKGYEARFPANSAAELRDIRRLLLDAGVTLGKPFEKRRTIVQPVYGKTAVMGLCELLGIEVEGRR